MTEQVKRYHKNFIGLMEQCNDGKWVRSEDFEAALQAKEAEAEAMRSWADSLIEKWQGLYNKEVTHNNKLFMQLQQAGKTILLYECVMVFMVVVGVVIEVIGAYHG